VNAFSEARTVEAEALFYLRPFIQEKSNGQFVLCEKGPLAQFLQETIGDALMFHAAADKMVSVEIKAERDHTGNLFLETWSNRNLKDKANRAAAGLNPGWMKKLRADLLFYYFLDKDVLYIFDLFKLQRWAFVSPSKIHGSPARRIYDFEEKPQGRYQQRNDTWGCVVPLSVLYDEVGCQDVNPRQLALQFGEASA
jgi:hypothetical protein